MTTTTHKPNIMILGPSGSGKSTSLRNLPPSETAIIDIERKGFPFKGLEDFTTVSIKRYSDMAKAIAQIKDMDHIKYVVHESFTKFTEMIQRHCNEAYNGFEIWKNTGLLIEKYLNDYCKSTTQIHICTAIDQIYTVTSHDGGEYNVIDVGVEGKMKERKIAKEFLCVLYTFIKKSDKPGERPRHLFKTYSDGIIPAKAPMYLDLPGEMPNDVMEVIKKLEA